MGYVDSLKLAAEFATSLNEKTRLANIQLLLAQLLTVSLSTGTVPISMKPRVENKMEPSFTPLPHSENQLFTLQLHQQLLQLSSSTTRLSAWSGISTELTTTTRFLEFFMDATLEILMQEETHGNS